MSSSAQNQAQEPSTSKDAPILNTTSATAVAPKSGAISTSPDTQAAAASSNNTNNNNTTSSTGNAAHINTGTTTPAMAAVVAAATAAAAASTDAKNQETDEDAIRNQKLVEEFQYLLEKSQSLFSGLRDLPPTGSHRQWRPLWKFQQTHRSILENKSNYGLKRWEVGEIASKIGQLYYHYYLRTSETNYLHEAYVFYEAIHERQYFKDILEVKNSALMIKKMRYYARFIIVCLLLNKDENVRQLITELEGLIEEYTKSFKPPDAKEWQMVLEEISTFTEAEKKLVPINLDRTPDKIEHRLASNIAQRHIVGLPKLKLQEAILVGNYQKQIKFSELTLDMYRMLQSLEREPFVLHPSVAAATKNKSTETSDKTKEASNDDQGNTAAAGTTTAATTAATSSAAGNTSRPAGASANTHSASHIQTTSEKMLKRSNPHKYLLYRPSLSQLLVYISTAFKDTSDNSALLLYLSADGCAYPDQTVPGYGGGVMTSQRNKLTMGITTDRASGAVAASSSNTAAPSSNSNAAAAAAASSSSNTANAGPAGTGVSGANTSSSTTVGSGGAGANSSGTIPATASAVGSMTASASNVASANAASNTGNTNNREISANTQHLADSHHHHISPPSVHCLHPADLVPFTRKPLFLIVDSDHSTEFKHMPNVFDQPVMCLMSPVEYPSSVQDKSEIGSLFTLFLHTPLLGFCSVSDIGNLDQQKWDECVRKIGAMEKAIGDVLLTDSNVDHHVKRFMMDDFLYYFIVRFVLCGVFLRYHSSFKDDKSFPSSWPSLPESIYVSTEIVTMLGDLTAIADVGTYFSLPAYATTSAANSVINIASSSTSVVAAANGSIGGATAANSASTASTATTIAATLPAVNNNSTNTNSNIASSPPPPSSSQTSTLATTTAIMEMK
ncbi:protein SCAI-like isoform X2 [Mucor ambiguus]|uniref:Protein SCAI-like isoform X2 n=1 Tax=Mucor ambiguus TaxID=91626 RepID=A0A0C9MNN8_9FUNG|nr:protein SCAI-like isoform X2 [Mucor ambiguus]